MKWRFIPYKPYTAAMNMAIDELLLEKQKTSSYQATLRLYGFSPPALTIGYNQNIDLNVIKRAYKQGFHIARRPTGGRAVIHFNDLTYSFISCEVGTRTDAFLASSVSTAYKQICSGLQACFQNVGLIVELGLSKTSYRHETDCFAAITGADLHYKGKKLVGSAQLHRYGSVLQHGSIPLDLDQEKMSEFLGNSKVPIKKNPEERHANLFELTGRKLSTVELEQAFQRGFASTFNTVFESVPLTQEEEEFALAKCHHYLITDQTELYNS